MRLSSKAFIMITICLRICKNYVDDKFINFENNKVINVKHKHTSLQKCE